MTSVALARKTAILEVPSSSLPSSRDDRLENDFGMIDLLLSMTIKWELSPKFFFS